MCSSSSSSSSSCKVLGEVSRYGLIFSHNSSLGVRVIFLLLADNVKSVFGFILRSFYSRVSSISSDNSECNL